MKKILALAIAAFIMIGCKVNEPQNVLVGRAYNTIKTTGEQEYDRLLFKSNSTVDFTAVFKDGYVSNKSMFYSFDGNYIIMGYDSRLTEILDTFSYHDKYLDRGIHDYYHLRYDLEQ